MCMAPRSQAGGPFASRARLGRSTLSVMDFGYSTTVEQWRQRVQSFLDEVILPVERTFHEQVHAQAGTNPWGRPPIMEELKAQARERGLWNLFLPGTEFGAGLTNLHRVRRALRRAGRDRAQVVVQWGHGAGVRGCDRDGPVSTTG